MTRDFIFSCLVAFAISLVAGCGEEAVEGKPAVGYGTDTPKPTSPIDNQLPAPKPLEIPVGAETN